MGQFIIHRQGAYNIFSTVSDRCLLPRAVTLQGLEAYTKEHYGSAGMQDLLLRLARAHETGCSAHDCTLDEVIEGNRAGPQECELPRLLFISRFLTLPGTTKFCETCKQPLDQPGKPESSSNGDTDCVACMADHGDSEAIDDMNSITLDAAKLEAEEIGSVYLRIDSDGRLRRLPHEAVMIDMGKMPPC